MTYDQSRAIAVTLNIAEMAVYDPRPMSVMAVARNVMSQVLLTGVRVWGLIRYQNLLNGMSSSLDSAQNVRAPACMPVICYTLSAHSVAGIPCGGSNWDTYTSEVEDDECKYCECHASRSPEDVVEDLCRRLLDR